MSEHAVPAMARLRQAQRAGLIRRTVSNVIDAAVVDPFKTS